MPRIARFHRFGLADVLSLEPCPSPTPQAGEVLIKVQAVGLGWKDILWRQNLAAEPTTLPSGFGFELAGVITELGPGVEGFASGQAVAAFPAATPNQYPAWGDEVLMPVSALTAYPAVLTPEQASVHYMGYLYAYLAMVHLADIQPKQWLLITEAARYLAPQAVLMGKALGAQVIACTRWAENRRFLQELGADHVIVTDEQDLVFEVQRITEGVGVQVIYDQCAGAQLKDLGAAAAPLGSLIIYGANGANDSVFPAREAFKKHLRIYRHCLLDYTGCAALGIAPSSAVIERALCIINDLTAAGSLPAVIDKVFAFEDFVAAQQYLERCPERGRVVLTLAADSKPSE